MMLDVEKVRQVFNANVIYAEHIKTEFGKTHLRFTFPSGRQQLVTEDDEGDLVERLI